MHVFCLHPQLNKLTSPKDDITGELKTEKLDTKKKLEQTDDEEDELADALAAAGKLQYGWGLVGFLYVLFSYV